MWSAQNPSFEFLNPVYLYGTGSLFVYGFICGSENSISISIFAWVYFKPFFWLFLFCFVYPQLFLDNIDTMVIQLDSATSLNLFLMDLKEENMTQTMYAAAYRRPAPTLSLGAGRLSKVDVLCDAMLESLYRVNPNKSVSDYLSVLDRYIRIENVITINLKHSIMLSMQLLVFSCITASICLLFDFCTNFPNTILPFYSICFI